MTPVAQRADPATTPSAPAEAETVTAPTSPARPVTPHGGHREVWQARCCGGTSLPPAQLQHQHEPMQSAQKLLRSLPWSLCRRASRRGSADSRRFNEALVTPVTLTVAAEPFNKGPAGQPVLPRRTVRLSCPVAPGLTQSKPRPPERLMDGANVAQQCCFNIADAAKDARYAWQKKTRRHRGRAGESALPCWTNGQPNTRSGWPAATSSSQHAEDNVVKIYGYEGGCGRHSIGADERRIRCRGAGET